MWVVHRKTSSNFAVMPALLVTLAAGFSRF